MNTTASYNIGDTVELRERSRGVTLTRQGEVVDITDRVRVRWYRMKSSVRNEWVQIRQIRTWIKPERLVIVGTLDGRNGG